MSSPSSLERLMPHRPPMLLLDRVLEHDTTSIVCQARVHEHSPFVRHGAMPAVATLEHMAQATAAWLGLRAIERGEPVGVGYLVGSRQLELAVDELGAGEELEVRAEHVWGEEQFATFACSVHRGGVRVASAVLSVARRE